MNFTVLWTPHAESRLADLWVHATDRRSITEAAAKIDDRLREEAHRAGESRGGNRRIVHEPPLGAIFSVNPADRRVLVLDVWRYEKRGG